jgi:protoporphyrinogen oxidase
MQQLDTLIIGAGLTGLSCAYHLKRPYLLVEAESEPGGMVRTRNCHGGFLCDGTGHWLHLRNPYMKALAEKLLPGGWAEHERKAVIHMRGVFTPYPFQANTFGLPSDVVLDCLLGLLRARHPADFNLPVPGNPPANFKEWVQRAFGEGIAKHFMIPYNEKLLGVPLEELRPEYAERFIPRPSLEDVVKGALGFSRESLGYNAKFIYPRTGGISALPQALAAALPTRPAYNTRVEKLDFRARTARLSDGREVRYQHLVNTSPLLRFLNQMPDLPPAVAEAKARLRATTVYYFDIGVRGAGAAASNYHWIYFPESEFIFYRAGSYSAVNRGSAPAGCRSYYVEMSGELEGLLHRPDELRARVLADLKKARVLADSDEVLFAELREIPYAYVVFDQNYEATRQQLLEFLSAQDIQTGGRWGGWGYGGMEDALLDGKNAAERIEAEAATR